MRSHRRTKIVVTGRVFRAWSVSQCVWGQGSAPYPANALPTP